MCSLIRTEQAGEAAAESSDKSATEEAAGEAADKAAAEKAAAEASDKDVTEKAAAEASDKDAADAAGEASTEAAGADAGEEKKAEVIPYWTEDSPAMASIIDYVKSLTDENSDEFVPEEERVAVFDMDGTLYGELFPTYFDQCLLMYRLLHDDTYQASAEDREFAQALETALLHGEKEPDSPRSTAQMAAESFKGYTVEQYRDYVRKFMSQPAVGFENMTYGEGFYEPMAALVQYLAEHGFRVYICSGTERSLARELSEDKLGKWIPPYQVIGSSFSLTATGKGDTADRDYTYTSDDQVLLEGNMTYKNLKWGKIVNTQFHAKCDVLGYCPEKHWCGKYPPSSETPLVLETFKTFPEAKAIIHGHCKDVTYSPNLLDYLSKEYLAYGQWGELFKISPLLEKFGCAIMKLHGEIVIGESFDQALSRYREMYEKTL